jgi:hypothetical protein
VTYKEAADRNRTRVLHFTRVALSQRELRRRIHDNADLSPTISPVRRAIKYAWGTSAILLGVWEAAALGTRKLPTITDTARRCHVRRRRSTRIAIWAWLICLGRHLLSHPPL